MAHRQRATVLDIFFCCCPNRYFRAVNAAASPETILLAAPKDGSRCQVLKTGLCVRADRCLRYGHIRLPGLRPASATRVSPPKQSGNIRVLRPKAPASTETAPNATPHRSIESQQPNSAAHRGAPSARTRAMQPASEIHNRSVAVLSKCASRKRHHAKSASSAASP
jgi:hypothetical protein